MRKKIILKSTVVVSLIMCLLLIFNTAALAVESSPDALGVDKISISPRCGIVEGKTAQMQATLSPESAKESSVEWYSSNPSVISCTEDGIIEGLSAGDYADITCKAKIGSKKETVRIYCVESIGDYKESEFTDFLTLIYKQPFAGSLSSVHVSRKFLYSLLAEFLRIILPYFGRLILNTNTLNRVLLTGGECQVMGRYGSFAYIAVTDQSTATDGFVKYTHLDKVINGFLNLSSTDMDVWANGVTYENRKLTTTYKGEVEWVVGNEDYITFDKTTGQIVGIVPGQTTTITAKSDGMTAKCTIHLLYKWPQVWTAKTNKKTNIYQTEGTEYEKGRTLAKGETFVVQGDCGTDNGWAYGYYPISDNNKIWGYIPIADVSTKGTVSQYNNMTTTINAGTKEEKKVPVMWPMYDKSIKNISSPYGPRNITSSGTIHHRGFDITTGTPGEIAGEYVVASFSGIVTKIYKNTSDCGYCISISTDRIDPVTQKNISIIYMHLQEIPKYKNGVEILRGDYIQVGTIIGKVGKTNGNTDPDMGYHLHFEANSQNAAVEDQGRSDFAYTLNPMHFFIEEKETVTFSSTNSFKKYGGYWYDLNGGYQNEEIFKSYFNF